MPKSSVYVRLNWPSTDSETTSPSPVLSPSELGPKGGSLSTPCIPSAELAQTIECTYKDTNVSPSESSDSNMATKSSTNGNILPLAAKGNEESLPLEVIPHEPNLPSLLPALPPRRRNLPSQSPEIPPHAVKRQSAGNMPDVPVIPLPPRRSAGSLLKQMSEDICNSNSKSFEKSDSFEGCHSDGGSGKKGVQPGKPKLRSKTKVATIKARRYARSISASAVSVSTNTDPADFKMLADVTSGRNYATLPLPPKSKKVNSKAGTDSKNGKDMRENQEAKDKKSQSGKRLLKKSKSFNVCSGKSFRKIKAMFRWRSKDSEKNSSSFEKAATVDDIISIEDKKDDIESPINMTTNTDTNDNFGRDTENKIRYDIEMYENTSHLKIVDKKLLESPETYKLAVGVVPSTEEKKVLESPETYELSVGVVPSTEEELEDTNKKQYYETIYSERNPTDATCPGSNQNNDITYAVTPGLCYPPYGVQYMPYQGMVRDPYLTNDCNCIYYKKSTPVTRSVSSPMINYTAMTGIPPFNPEADSDPKVINTSRLINKLKYFKKSTTCLPISQGNFEGNVDGVPDDVYLALDIQAAKNKRSPFCYPTEGEPFVKPSEEDSFMSRYLNWTNKNVDSRENYELLNTDSRISNDLLVGRHMYSNENEFIYSENMSSKLKHRVKSLPDIVPVTASAPNILIDSIKESDCFLGNAPLSLYSSRSSPSSPTALISERKVWKYRGSVEQMIIKKQFFKASNSCGNISQKSDISQNTDISQGTDISQNTDLNVSKETDNEESEGNSILNSSYDSDISRENNRSEINRIKADELNRSMSTNLDDHGSNNILNISRETDASCNQNGLDDEDDDESLVKKSVTFCLPPEHWDSLLSLREKGGSPTSSNSLMSIRENGSSPTSSTCSPTRSTCSPTSSGYPQSGYAELDATLLPPNGQDPYRNTPSPGLHGAPQDRYVQWRDPDLHEVIDFLSNPNNVVKANAAAYLQHLCYMDDPTKQKTRILGGIPPLVALLSHDLPELHRNACGALRNLSYGRQNDENKRAIKDAGGIPSLVRLLRKTPDNEVKELVTGILWNLSSCDDLKQSIIDDSLAVIVSHVIIPCSGWDGGEVERDPNVDVWWSTVFKNASGILRNISSAGEYSRTKLRQTHGLVDSLLTVIKSAIQGSSHDNKSVENCVCVLRNLSYRCQEVEDPNYDKHQPPTQSRATATAKDNGDNLGCFGGSRKKKEAVGSSIKEPSSSTNRTGPRNLPVRGMELLWQPEIVVGPYLSLLSDCSNPETLEAAAGALQNLAACYWQPSIDVRAAVRKEKGLPILVELLRMEVDRVVCAVATALRNLAIDQRNKELIGKYAMRDLVQKLPSGNTHDSGTSDETIGAVLATLNEVIKKNAEFSRALLEAGGVERLVNMTRQRGRYASRVVKFASQVLFSMWGHQELREVYRKAGFKEQDFVSKSVAARNAAGGGGANSPTANNTLNRPMASQGGTRYEDRTIQRGTAQHKQQQPPYVRGEDVALREMGMAYQGEGQAPAGGVRLYPPMQGKPGEPVYAKVNRDKKRNRQYDGVGPQYGTLGGSEDWGGGGPVYGTTTPLAGGNSPGSFIANNNNTNVINNNSSNNSTNNGVSLDNQEGQAGDSWV